MINSHTIENIELKLVKARVRNWRKNPSRQVEEAARQLERTGQIVEPPLLDDQNRVVCGSAIVQAAKKLGWTHIPILRVANMTPDELRLYAINAHKLNDLGSYDDSLLAEELRELEGLLGEEVLTTLAAEEGEITRLLALAEAQEDDPSNLLGSEDNKPTITQPGDLWEVEQSHRVYCGNSLEVSSFEKVMDGQSAQFGLTDAPYNLSMSTISSDPSREEFAFAHGEMSPNEFTRFLTSVMRMMQTFSEDGSLHAFFMSYHFLLELLRAGTIVFGRPKALCTWIKTLPGQGSPFRSQTEQVAYFKKGDAPHIDNVQLGKHGRNRSTAWQYDGMTSFSDERAELLREHATPKPVELLQDAILDVTTRHGIVLDPFGGIGSTMVAAHAAERRAHLIEIEPRYVDVTLRRMRAAYGLEAVRARDGMTFSALEAQAKNACDDSA